MATTVRQPALTFTLTDGDGAVHAVSTALNTLTTASDGYFEEYYTTNSSTYTVVDFGQVATPQFVLVQNVDDTDDVIVAIGNNPGEEDCARLEPGCIFVTYLPSTVNDFSVKASANAPRARVVGVST